MPVMPLDIVPVILAGGQGRRLWPLTSAARPKPSLRLFSSYSLLQETLLRAAHSQMPYVICDHAHLQHFKAQAAALERSVKFIAEPYGRSTGPALALAACALEAENAPMLVMPSDHYIADLDGFYRSIKKAYDMMLQGAALVQIGVRPAAASTRYGYIVCDENNAVETFTEKPDAASARALLRTQNCFWNSGIFLVRPQYLRAAFQNFATDILSPARASLEGLDLSQSILQPRSDIYKNIPARSIDHAVLNALGQKGFSARVVLLESDWCDVGTWCSLVTLKCKFFTQENR